MRHNNRSRQSTAAPIKESKTNANPNATRKPGPVPPYGLRHGINDYASWFANDPDMRGDYHDTMDRARHGMTH
jgi:hypothetical protein